MRLARPPFATTTTATWDDVPATVHAGASGHAQWRTRQFGEVRFRMVDYSPGYLAEHWYSKGHFLLCLTGELHTELADGRSFILAAGMSYQVADQAEMHRASAPAGARLFIVD